MKKLFALLILTGLVLCGSKAFADVGCKGNGTNTGCNTPVITNLDFKFATGSDFATQQGLTRAIPVLGSTMFATGVANGGATSIASTVNAIPVGFGFVRIVADSDGNALFTAKTLANGTPGQYLTIYVSGLSPSGATTGGNATITPTTSTGFSSIKLSAVNDNITLHYMDSVIGWTIVSWDPGASNSITINLKN